MRDPNETRPAKWRRTGKGRTVLWTAVAILATGSVFAAQAIADSRPVQHLRQFVADGGMLEVTPAQFPHGSRFGDGHAPPSLT